MNLLDRRFARAHQSMCLLAEVPLAGFLLPKVLLVVEEKVSAVSELLEKKGMILLGSETGGRGVVVVFWRFACDLVLLEPFLFG